jgi:hypothetical protein
MSTNSKPVVVFAVTNAKINIYKELSRFIQVRNFFQLGGSLFHQPGANVLKRFTFIIYECSS